MCTSGCRTAYYNQTASTTVEVIPDSESELAYGSADLFGYYVRDTVCLTENVKECVVGFKFFEITNATGLTGTDGILGFSPIQSSAMNNGDSMIQFLHNNTIIENPTA